MSSSVSGADIFNANKIGLFFSCLLKETHAFKGEACYRGKLAKDILTVLISTNAKGSEKLPSGHQEVDESEMFQECHAKSLPIEYASNSRAWMRRGSRSLIVNTFYKVDPS